MSNVQFSRLSKSHLSTDYQTPKDLYDKLDKIFHFKLDPCTSPENPLQVMKYYTKVEDGLKKDWDANTFANPPFGRGIDRWLYHMYSQATIYENCKYVMLLPAKTDVKWFQEQIMNMYKEFSSIYFLKGRLKFTNPDLNRKSNPHIIGSMLWIMNANDEELSDLRYSIPGVLLKEWS